MPRPQIYMKITDEAHPCLWGSVDGSTHHRHPQSTLRTCENVLWALTRGGTPSQPLVLQLTNSPGPGAWVDTAESRLWGRGL